MIQIYTDGSCKNNPGLGSYGYIIYINNLFSYSYLEYNQNITTNNIMELMAILTSLKNLYNFNLYTKSCILFTDSQYAYNGINKWIIIWINNDWKTSEQKPVLNREIWQEIWNIYNKFTNISIEWIRAHTNNVDIHSLRNRYVDELIQ